MLKHTLTHPKINEVLGCAGHHSLVLIADGNYPVQTKRGPNSTVVHLNLAPDLVRVADALKTLLTAVPVDAVEVMGMPPDDSYAQSGEPPAWADYRKIIGSHGRALELGQVQKWDFYRKVESPDHVLTIQTGDLALWANVLLTIGCRTV